MPTTSWIQLLGGALVTGAAVVGLLSLKRSHEPLALVAALVSTSFAGAGLARVVIAYGRAEVTLLAALLALGVVGGGFGLASSVLTHMASRKRPVELVDEGASLDGDPTVVVVVLACIEPETYDPSTTARDLIDLADAGLPEAGIGITPFLYAAQKARYRAAGGRSPAAAQARSVTAQLQGLLGREQFPRVDLVTCNSREPLAAHVARLYRRGFRRIIVAEASVAESFEIDRAKTSVDALRPEAFGFEVAYTSPLWASDRIVNMVAARIVASTQNPSTTGVALLMHGQPEDRERTHAGFDVQENAFVNRVRMTLVERGHPENNIRLCRTDWRPPDVTETVRHLAALGCTRILVVPACYPFESVSTVLDLTVAMRQARVDSHVYVTRLSAWGEDPVVAEALRSAVMVARSELDLR
ncbi:MAG: ferrochelatase [Coriobacteriia bacterium]|nr:ferrochelatase [Coriobacteriia bacterium]